MNLDEYKQQLEKHDWFYAFSDSHYVWQKGMMREKQLMHIAETQGNEFKKAFNEAHAKRFNTDTFSKPYHVPYPNAI